MTEVQSIRELGDAWDEAVERCAFHDAFHHAAYHRAMGGDGAPLLLCSGSDDPAVWAFPLLLRPIAEVAPGHAGFDAFGIYGFSGIAWDPARGGEYAWPQIWEAVRNVLQLAGVVSVFSRWHPLDASDMPLPAHAVLSGLGESVVIDLAQDDATYLAGMKKGHRYDVRRAERDGLVVDSTSTATFLDEFYDLYEDTMQRVGANSSYYFGRDRLRHLYDDDRFTVLTLRARLGPATLANSMFLVHPPFAHYFLSGSSSSDEHGSRPSKYLIHVARPYLRDRGATALHLGGGVGSIRDSLFEFKAGFTSHRARFRGLRWVVDEGAYRELLGRGSGPFQGDIRPASSGWFPPYRASDA